MKTTLYRLIYPILGFGCGTVAAETNMSATTMLDGRIFRGEPAGVFDGRLFIAALDSAGGRVTYRLPVEQIRQFEFQEEAIRRTEAALGGLEADDGLELGRDLLNTWLPYLALADDRIQLVLTSWIEALLATGAAEEALGAARSLLPAASPDTTRHRLHTVILLAHESLNLRAEAAHLAREWCRLTDPESGEAAGWRILAEAALADDNPGEAAWMALHPLALGPAPDTPEIRRCYALAIEALARLDARDEASAIALEMHTRGFAWPADPDWEAGSDLFIAAIESSAPPRIDEEIQSDRPPEEDLRLPLSAARRVLAADGADPSELPDY